MLDPTCAHHYAPSDLTVTMDWSAEPVRLRPGATPTQFAAVLPPVGAGAHWVHVLDIQYCGTEQGPVALTGVRLGVIGLTRAQQTEPGIYVLAFEVTPAGTVRP